MLYRLRDVPAMLATPIGRSQVGHAILFRLWLPLRGMAWVWRRTALRRTRVIAVVGSFGKSTTTRAVAAAVGLPPDTSMSGNAWSWLALVLLRIRPSQRRAVVEVGIAAPGEMEIYARLVRPAVTVVTTIGSEHQRHLKTLEGTRAEKSRMLRVLPRSGTAVLNGDDPNVMWMAGQTQARVITYGFGAACDVRAADLQLDWPRGSRFHVTAFGVERAVATRFIGRHMVYPALAAIAVAHVEGISLDGALASLAALPPTAGRMQPVVLSNDRVLLLDEYKGTLETMHAALDALAAIPARRRIVVFGDVAEAPPGREAIYRQLGARVAGMAAHMVVTGYGREDYASGARAAGMPAAAIHDGAKSARETAAALQAILQPGDVVLIKGRRGQMLDRVRLILQGARVACDIGFCDQSMIACARCPMRETGWNGHRMIIQRGVKV